VNLNKGNFLVGFWVITFHQDLKPHYGCSLIEGFMRSIINEYSSIPLFVCRINDAQSVDDQVTKVLHSIQNLSHPETVIEMNESKQLVPKLVPLNLVPEVETVTSDTWVLNYDGEDINFVSLLDEELEDDEVYIKVKCAGVNFKDILTSKGLLTDLGRELGSSQFGIECSGIIEGVGSQVTDYCIGDEVIAFGDFCFTTHLTTESNLCFKKPNFMSWETAATVGIAYTTAYHSLIERAGLCSEDVVLIHSACGGVGLAAVNIAKMVGCKIIGTAGTPEKRAYLQEVCKVEWVSDSHSLKWVEDVKKWTDNRGVDVILNSLSGKFIPACLKSLSPGGRMCEIGKRDILQNSKLDMRPLLENKSFLSVQMDFLMKECPSRIKGLLSKVIELSKENKVSALPTKSFSIFDYKEILSSMSSGMQIGKIVFAIPPNPTVTCIRSKPVLFQPRYSYLVTGAFGGIGQHFLKWMVKEGAMHIFVITRNGAADFGSRMRTLQWLHDNGVTLQIISADLTSMGDIHQALSQVEASKYPLKGVFHIAGKILNAPVGNMKVEEMWECIHSKATSALHLHRLTLEKDLDFFITFSSVACSWGNPEQSAYVAANNALDELMIHRRSIGLPGISLQLGAVEGAGYLTDNKKAAMITENKGMLSLHIDEYLTILSSILRNLNCSLPPVITITNSDWEKTTNFCPRTKHRISHLIKRRQDITDNSNVTEQQFQQTVCGKLSNLLGLPLDDVDIQKPMTDYGVDSLMAVELVNWIKKEIGINVSQLDILGGMTTASLLQKSYRGETCLPRRRSTKGFTAAL